jgi:basic membrane lipoprotein Med (substrate-binding protein (PBP1-ABC) superfamily)
MRIATRTVASAVYALGLAAAFAARAGAQTSEVKERAPMYTYEASRVYPRAMWPGVDKGSEAGRKIVEKAMTSGGLAGFGSDARVIHAVEGETQHAWFSGTSQASMLDVLDEVAEANSGSSILTSATKHWDGLYVSRYYNWKAGSWKGAYTRASTYTLKADAPNDAIDILAKCSSAR